MIIDMAIDPRQGSLAVVIGFFHIQPAILQPVTEIQPLALVTRTKTHGIAFQAIVIIIGITALEQC